jgi:hypothetical protein
LDTHYFNQVLSIADGVVTISIYVKANGYNYFTIRDASNSNTYAKFDLNLGLTETTGSAAISSAIDSVGNGWFRCSLTLNRVAGGSNNLIFYTNNTYTNAAIYSGDGISGIYIQDAQINEGPTAKPYFPTTNRQDVPRLDYSNGCPCLLLEPQRTNSLLYSEQFDNAYWGKGNASISANSTTSPDGTQNADSLLEQAVSGIHYVGKTVSAVAGSYTFSGFIKQNTRQFGGFRAIVNGFANRYFVLLDLSNGSVVSTNTVGSGVTWSHSVESFANGWYRLSVSATHTSGNIDLSFSPSDSESPTYSAGLPNYTGDASKSIYIWGAQLEQGSYPTSYIPTTSAAVTRVADDCNKADVSSLLGSATGAAMIDFVLDGPDANGNIPITLGVDTNNLIYFWFRTNGSISLDIYQGGSLQGQIQVASPAFSYGTRYKAAFAWANNDFVLYINGVNKGTDTSGLAPTPTKIWLAQYVSGNYKGAKINQTILFPTRLTNTELAALTTL